MKIIEEEEVVVKRGKKKKGGRKVTWIMDDFTAGQLAKIREFWNLDQTRAIEVAIEFMERDIAAMKARGVMSGTGNGG